MYIHVSVKNLNTHGQAAIHFVYRFSIDVPTIEITSCSMEAAIETASQTHATMENG